MDHDHVDDDDDEDDGGGSGSGGGGANNFDDDNGSSVNDNKSRPVVYYQLGAPTLLYDNTHHRQNNNISSTACCNNAYDDDDNEKFQNFLDFDDRTLYSYLSVRSAIVDDETNDYWNRINRVKTHWYHPPSSSSLLLSGGKSTTRRNKQKVPQHRILRRRSQQAKTLEFLEQLTTTTKTTATTRENRRVPPEESGSSRSQRRMSLSEETEDRSRTSTSSSDSSDINNDVVGTHPSAFSNQDVDRNRIDMLIDKQEHEKAGLGSAGGRNNNYNSNVDNDDYDSNGDYWKVNPLEILRQSGLEATRLFERPYIRRPNLMKDIDKTSRKTLIQNKKNKTGPTARARRATQSTSVCHLTHMYNTRRIQNSDPSYTAPFDIASMKEARRSKTSVFSSYRPSLASSSSPLPTTSASASSSFRNQDTSSKLDLPLRSPQGNTLVTFTCPLDCCGVSSTALNDRGNFRSDNHSSVRTWIILHPIGPCLDKLSVRRLIPPNQQYKQEKDQHPRSNRNTKTRRDDSASGNNATIVDLGDTILEVRDCGPWTKHNNQNQMERTIVVRTGCFVTTLSVICSDQRTSQSSRSLQPQEEGEENGKGNGSTSGSSRVCTASFQICQRQQLDLRSMHRSVPSLLPVSLTTHPRYGMPFSPSRFSVAYHSSLTSSPSFQRSQNIIQSFNHDGNTGRISSYQRHDISNLRTIDLIDYTSNNPMCLWSAASSYVHPALSPGPYDRLKHQPNAPFGFGTALYSIDLRTNTATFQWSPSAEEMMTEGIHSINGLKTNWMSDNVVWVSSKSAGKTWEIDGRMPCRAVQVWSISSSCDESLSPTIPESGFHHEPSLFAEPFTSTVSKQNSKKGIYSSPIIKVDTDYFINGMSLLQRPLRKPRFQTDSLQSIASHAIHRLDKASIATSSYYAFPDVSEHTYTCGIATITLPFRSMDQEEENVFDAGSTNNDKAQKAWKHCYTKNSSILCVLTATNHGDIYQHALIESDDPINDEILTGSIQRFEGLGIGTSAIPIPEMCDHNTLETRHGQYQSQDEAAMNLVLSNTYPTPLDVRVQRQAATRGGTFESNDESFLRRKKAKLMNRRNSSRGASDAEMGDSTATHSSKAEDTIHIRSDGEYVQLVSKSSQKNKNGGATGEDMEGGVKSGDSPASTLILPKQSGGVAGKIQLYSRNRHSSIRSISSSINDNGGNPGRVLLNPSRKSDLQNSIVQGSLNAFEEDSSELEEQYSPRGDTAFYNDGEV